MLYILVAILMFGILIAFHEFGHFFAAKLCGVKVNEFAIGMGPLLLHRQKGETEYSLRLLPIGGFCAMEGEEEGVSDDPRAFPNRPWYQRLIILLAGVFMNFLTGFFIILCFFLPQERFSAPVVTEATSPAAQEFLLPGDRILEVDGHAIYLTADIGMFIARGGDDLVDLEVRRAGERLEIKNFRLFRDGDELKLGVGVAAEANTPLVLLKNSWYQAVDYVRMVWMSLGDLITGQVGVRDMSGVVGIVDMVGDLGQEGAAAAKKNGKSALLGALTEILWFVAFISINLSVMNLLPIPALDGGQVFLMAVNGILLALRGRKLDPKYQGWVSAAGFACLMALMLAVTVSDILKQFGV